LVARALKVSHNIGIAYTYNEPFTFYEFMFETAQLAHEKGLKNVVVSNGYINPEPLKSLLPFIDAFNIDLKAFTDEFYHKHTKGKLNPVLETLKLIAGSRSHLEITNLVIPGLNDDELIFEEMVKWIASELGTNIPLHLSRYFPQFEMGVAPTPIDKLESLYNLAKNYIHFVYLGNVNDEKRSSTYCPDCGKTIILRNHYKISIQNIDQNGCCMVCGTAIKIMF